MHTVYSLNLGTGGEVWKRIRHDGDHPTRIYVHCVLFDLRDNLVVKYGKGYAMTETTLLVCDFSEAADTAEKLAKRRKKVALTCSPFSIPNNSPCRIPFFE